MSQASLSVITNLMSAITEALRLCKLPSFLPVCLSMFMLVTIPLSLRLYPRLSYQSPSRARLVNIPTFEIGIRYMDYHRSPLGDRRG